jgi:hypothetical protein
MPARTLVLAGSLAVICVLAFLTVRVAVEQGVDILVVLSFGILVTLGVGVVGALGNPPPEE